MHSLFAAIVVFSLGWQENDGAAEQERGTGSTLHSDLATTRPVNDPTPLTTRSSKFIFQPEVCRVLDFDVDDQGRIGFFRTGEHNDKNSDFVLINPDGQLITVVSLKDIDFGRSIPTLAWSRESEWFIWPGFGKTSRGCFQAWILDAGKKTIKNRCSTSEQNFGAFAPDHKGGFVAFWTETKHLGGIVYSLENAVLAAFDEIDNEVWRVAGHPNGVPSMPSYASLTVARDGAVVLYDQNDEGLLVFSESGQFVRKLRSSNLRHCSPNWTSVYAGLPGEVLIGGSISSQPVLRVLLSTEKKFAEAHPIVAREDFGRAKDPRGRKGYRFQTFAPNDPEIRIPLNSGNARAAPDGRIWLQAGDGFYLLDGKGKINLILGGDVCEAALRR